MWVPMIAPWTVPPKLGKKLKVAVPEPVTRNGRFVPPDLADAPSGAANSASTNRSPKNLIREPLAIGAGVTLIPATSSQNTHTNAEARRRYHCERGSWGNLPGVRTSIRYHSYSDGVRRAACGVRRAACGVRRAACGVRRAACGVRRAACGVRRAALRKTERHDPPGAPRTGKLVQRCQLPMLIVAEPIVPRDRPSGRKHSCCPLSSPGRVRPTIAGRILH